MAKHQGQTRTGRDGSLDIIFEDADIVVVIKPVGIPVINPDGGRGRNLLDMVSTHIQRRHPRARAALVHRLDRDTSGVMVFATNARAKKTLMDEWQERAKDRRYVALVEGDLGSESGILDCWIAPAGPSLMRVARQGENEALRARGSWKRLASGAGFDLLEVRLDTGRKHQIRVQLAALGHPVSGDARYGARSDPAGRVMLHASLLELVHPVTDEVLRFECPSPRSFTSALRTPVTWEPRQR